MLTVLWNPLHGIAANFVETLDDKSKTSNDDNDADEGTKGNQQFIATKSVLQKYEYISLIYKEKTTVRYRIP